MTPSQSSKNVSTESTSSRYSSGVFRNGGGLIEVLLARLAARAVKVGVDLGHRAGIVDVGG
jgi:hypothetical protein